MIITNKTRRQAIDTFNRITKGFHGWTYSSDYAADNGQVSVYIRENHDVIYYSNYFTESTLMSKLSKQMLERILPAEQEEQRNFDFWNKVEKEGPFAYSN